LFYRCPVFFAYSLVVAEEMKGKKACAVCVSSVWGEGFFEDVLDPGEVIFL
jgi:hypothetical protein